MDDFDDDDWPIDSYSFGFIIGRQFGERLEVSQVR